MLPPTISCVQVDLYLVVLSKAVWQTRGLAVLRFWRRIKRVVPTLFAAVRKILLLKPSSATNERIFSMLARFFGPFSGSSIAIIGTDRLA